MQHGAAMFRRCMGRIFAKSNKRASDTSKFNFKVIARAARARSPILSLAVGARAVRN